MGDRIDETKGQINRGVGDLTGSDDMAREGHPEADRAKAGRDTEGAIDQGGGEVQEFPGDVADDPETDAKGNARQAEEDSKRAG